MNIEETGSEQVENMNRLKREVTVLAAGMLLVFIGAISAGIYVYAKSSTADLAIRNTAPHPAVDNTRATPLTAGQIQAILLSARRNGMRIEPSMPSYGEIESIIDDLDMGALSGACGF